MTPGPEVPNHDLRHQTVRRRGFFSLIIVGATMPILARAETADPVKTPIRDFYAALETQMRAGRAVTFRHRFDTLAPVIDRVFNIDSILRLSAGRQWASLDAASQTALKQAFRRFTIASYVANFDQYDDEKFELLRDLRPSGADRIVPTRIIAANGDATRLDYLMHHDDVTGWRVTDILLEGTISRVAVLRSDFRGLIAAGNASALLSSLHQKIADLSGGSLNS
jgi:phospholipid transport system substrate-binding protein